MRFRSIDELEDYLNDDNNYNELSDRQKLRQTQKSVRGSDISQDAEKVYEDSKWVIYVPKTYEASCKLGQGTTWCTATTSGDYYYKSYTKQGKLYIIINKNEPDEKYQFHFESEQFMDKDDMHINLSDFLEENAGVKNFFTNIVVSDNTPVVITFEDFAKKASSKEVSEDFLLSALNTLYGIDYTLDEYFDGFFGDALYDMKNNTEYVYDYLNDTSKEILSDMGVDTSDAEGFADSIQDSEDAYDLVLRALENALTNGAVAECLSDLKESIKDAFLGEEYKVEGNGSFVISPSKEERLEAFLNYLDYPDEDLEYFILTKYTERFSFYEPLHGWVRVAEETFNDDIEYFS